MALKIIIEILILWIVYALYMALLVHHRGPIGAIFFYPKAMQVRVVTLKLTTYEEIKQRRLFAVGLLLAWMTFIPMFMIVTVNGAKSFWDCFWQYYVLFMGAEFFDWLFIDTIWVALSSWWIIEGTEDLNNTWHSVHIKKWKLLQLLPIAVPIAAIVAGICQLFIK